MRGTKADYLYSTLHRIRIYLLYLYIPISKRLDYIHPYLFEVYLGLPMTVISVNFEGLSVVKEKFLTDLCQKRMIYCVYKKYS